MGDVQPALGLLATAVLNTAFAVAAGCLTSLWALRRTNSPWSRSKIDSLVVALRTSLVICGLAFALLLRFEFMNQGFAKVVAFFATTSTCLIIYVFLVQVFGDGSAPF